jgi:hypothetical protein
VSDLNCLYLGKGRHEPARKLAPVASADAPAESIHWTTVDMVPRTKPDILFDLNNIEYGHKLPVESGYFDEIHAYDVIEHYGCQGDYKGWFTGWREFWRILKPGGYVIGNCPAWNVEQAWCDPGHTRIVTEGMLRYMTKAWYADADAIGNQPTSSYESHVDPCWWELDFSTYFNTALFFVMRKV